MRRAPPSLHFACAAILAFVGSCSFYLGGKVEELDYYPGKLRIKKTKNLSKEEREIEARFAKYLEDRTDEAMARYKEKFGKRINTDNARELSSDYAPGGIEATDLETKAARSTWSHAVHEPASALVKEMYRRELEKLAGPDELDRVVFTAGGTAAGKTTALRNMPAVTTVAEHAQIIYDTTLSDLKSSMERVAQALKSGKTVSIVYLHRDPVEALIDGALPRAEIMGRTIPLESFLRTHLDAPKVFLQIANQYEDDPRVAISVIDNSRGRGKAIVVDLEFLKHVASKYTPERLKAKLNQALEDAYEKGKRGEEGGISETVYRAFRGDAFKRVYGPLGSGDGKHPELQDRGERAAP